MCEQNMLLVCAFRRTLLVVCFYPRLQSYLVSGSWSPEQCWVWVPCPAVVLKQNQTSFGYSYKLCCTIALACLTAGGKHCRLKGLPIGFPLFSCGSPLCLCFALFCFVVSFFHKATFMIKIHALRTKPYLLNEFSSFQLAISLMEQFDFQVI